MLAIIQAGKKKSLQLKATIDWYKIGDEAGAYYKAAANDNWRQKFVPVMGGIMEDQGQLMKNSFGFKFDVPNVQSLEWFNDYTLVFAQPINQTSSDGISNLMQQAQKEGWSIPTMQDHLGVLFDQWMNGDGTSADWEWYADRLPAHRLEMIARTESMRASNYGNSQLMGEWGVERKEWLATADDRTRDSHYAAWVQYSEGGSIPLDEPFIVGGAELMYPGDPGGPPEETINCRCTQIPAMDSSEVNNPYFADDQGSIPGDEEPMVNAPAYAQPANATPAPEPAAASTDNTVYQAFNDDMKHDWASSLSGLSAEDLAAVKAYTGHKYSYINQYLRLGPDEFGNRYGGERLAKTQELTTNIQNAYTNNGWVSNEDIVTYRGFGKGWIDDSFLSNPEALIGTQLSDAGFISTSVNPNAAFSGGWYAEVHIPKGTPGAYIDSISYFPGEEEFLLGGGRKFEVVSAAYDNDMHKTKLVLEVIQ